MFRYAAIVLSTCGGVGVAVLAVVGLMVGLGVFVVTGCKGVSGKVGLEHADNKMNNGRIAIQQNLAVKYSGLSLLVRIVSSDR